MSGVAPVRCVRRGVGSL